MRDFPDIEVRREVRRRIPQLLTFLDELTPKQEMSRLEHSLQLATRARLANADSETILCGLCHDIGHVIPFSNHARLISEMLTPFVSQKMINILRWHTILGTGRYNDSPLMKDKAVQNFVIWDIESWDHEYGWQKLEEFDDVLDEVFLCRKI